MSKPMIREHNTETNEVIDREMTDDEFARYQEGQAKYQAEENLKAEAAAKRQVALDKLAALGLETDDLKALGL